MSDERRIAAALARVEVPGEGEAGLRCLDLALAAHARRVPERRPPLRLLALAALALVAAVAAVSAPGAALAGWLRDALGSGSEVRAPEPPAALRLPGGGQVLAVAPSGAWIVRADGTRRRLGAYDGGAFSRYGRFVAVTAGSALTALDPASGASRWSLEAPARVADPRWSLEPTVPPCCLIAYRAGDTLRAVGGDGRGDRLLARGVAPVAPAWRPRADTRALAYAAGGSVVLASVADGTIRWRRPVPAGTFALSWLGDGSGLLVAAPGELRLLSPGGSVRWRRTAPAAGRFTAGAAAPAGGRVAAVLRGADGRSRLLVRRPDGTWRTRLSAVAAFGDLAWSPGGERLALTWPAAGQWLVAGADGGAPRRIPDVGRRLAPGTRFGTAPGLEGWSAVPGGTS